jgi:hypothetical protein
MRRTRELVRRDLVALFGKPGQHVSAEREFADIGIEFWFMPATQERLRAAFTKRPAAAAR